MVTEADKEKEKLQKVFNGKLKQLQNEQNKKITEAKEIKDVTIKAFFKKEGRVLAKRQKSIGTNLARSTKEMDSHVSWNRVQSVMPTMAVPVANRTMIPGVVKDRSAWTSERAVKAIACRSPDRSARAFQKAAVMILPTNTTAPRMCRVNKT